MEENYIVSARKYRPSTFSSVVGQKALTATLRNAIATNRLAHAYLFCGSRGVGKTSCARIFAKTINCEHPTPDGDPCNECASCRQFNENRSLNILELDAASNNSVNDIRELTDQVLVPPTEGRYRVFIIDEVHMLSSAAFNAFLKTLEEPPSYVIFILATTEKHKIIPTILSRCQIYDFSRITIADIVDHLQYVASQEGITAERSALNVIARKADGAMRDALSIFDQVAASSRGAITYQSAIDNLNVLDERYYSRLVEAFKSGNVPEALLVYKDVRDHGFDSLFFINGLAQYLRDLMVARNPLTLPLLDTDEATREAMAAQGATLEPEFFYAAMSLCNEADLAYRQASSKTFLVELLLIRLCQQTGPSPIYSGAGEGQRLKKIEVADSTAEAAAPYRATPRQQPASVPPAQTQPQTVRPAVSHSPAVSVPSAPRVAPAPPARTPGRVAGRGHVSLASAFAEQKSEVSAAPGAVAPRHRNPVSEDALTAAWEKYMAANPKAHLLVNTMRAHRPVGCGDPSHPELFVVTVVNPGQVELLTQEKPRLLEFLRAELTNDYIDFKLDLNEDAAAPTAWSDRDVLNHLVETNPQLAGFITDFKLTLS
ncbi:MAG: DNA polymerase III subunit gamma/tau [Muribaculaceae bacterium]|nr:DNA polymerase III subunit gamma/tau [Muribaculaceae bacterium]